MTSPATLLAAIFSLLGPASGATQPRVAAVECRVEASKLATSDPKSKLRRELEEELDRIDWKAERVGPPFELIAVLAEGQSTATKSSTHASFSVRLVLREPSGALLGQVSARASGEERGASRAALEASVLEAASKSAASALPEAVRKARKAR